MYKKHKSLTEEEEEISEKNEDEAQCKDIIADVIAGARFLKARASTLCSHGYVRLWLSVFQSLGSQA